jgi:GNAT superfamily N-acetyltransferase
MAQDVIDAHRARAGERSQVVNALCRAFFEDPIYKWIIPDEDERRLSATIFYGSFVEACWAHGHVYAAGSGAGAALWVPPGEQLVCEGDAEAFSRELVQSAGDDACSARMAELLDMLDEHHPAEPCWHLTFMGVDPAAQGQGIGSALLATVLTRADHDDTPAYLEASCPQNRRLYERHGFLTTRELTVSDCPPLFAMWRPPKGHG